MIALNVSLQAKNVSMNHDYSGLVYVLILASRLTLSIVLSFCVGLSSNVNVSVKQTVICINNVC